VISQSQNSLKYKNSSLSFTPHRSTRKCTYIFSPNLRWFIPFNSYLNIEVLNQNFLQAYYITTARELARMVGIRKAPILHHFSESITGAATIRCFNQEERFLMRSLSLIDDYSRIVFHNSGTMEWLCIRINFLFNLGFFLVLIILVNLPKSAIDPSELLLSHIFSDPTSRETIHTNLQPRIFGTL